MTEHLNRRRRRSSGDDGFTLIELLVVVVIIGILIAIAIPVYLNYQKGARDKSAEADLKASIGVLEQCKIDNGAYPAGAVTIPGGYSYSPCPGQGTAISTTTIAYYSTPSADGYIVGATAAG